MTEKDFEDKLHKRTDSKLKSTLGKNGDNYFDRKNANAGDKLSEFNKPKGFSNTRLDNKKITQSYKAKQKKKKLEQSKLNAAKKVRAKAKAAAGIDSLKNLNDGSIDGQSFDGTLQTGQAVGKGSRFIVRKGTDAARWTKKHGFSSNKNSRRFILSKGKKANVKLGAQATKAKTAKKAQMLARQAFEALAASAKAMIHAITAIITTASTPILLVGLVILLVIMLITTLFKHHEDTCVKPSYSDVTTTEKMAEPPKSVDDFIMSHKDAYILSWKAGGYLPSVSIAQTMVENGFDFKNPSGTSLWQAHNMGGVKTSKKEDFPITLQTYGPNAVDVTGTKPGTNVGDGTGGAYTYFKDYNAGIVGKAEFMAHQPRYKNAVNNTNSTQTINAIADGGWATSADYRVHLQMAYNTVGKKYTWLDNEAIQKHGQKPYGGGAQLPTTTIPTPEVKTPPTKETKEEVDEDGCVARTDPDKDVKEENSTTTAKVPEKYKDKLTLPPPNDKTYIGNSYPFGQCTWGAYNRMSQLGHPIEWFSGDGGNGGSWGESAKARGYTVVKGKPEVGWAVSFPGGVAGSDSNYGHVAVVEYVNPDGSFLVSETNVMDIGSGNRSWRVIKKSDGDKADFIQGKG